ncbi:MAG: FAD-dependent oxidoreductase [Pirellulales bacterium]
MNRANQRGQIWFNWSGPGCDPIHQLVADSFSIGRPYDVAIIGAGVIGCALAYQLSQYRLRTVMIDKAFDVGEGTSKGNSAIIHSGFDAMPGSLESQLVTSASRQWPELAQKLKIPFKPVSALMLAFNEEQCAQLPALREKALANGVDDLETVSAEEAKRMEPNIAAGVLGGLVIPRESIVDPFTTSIAYAEVAVENGVDVVFGLAVTDIDDAEAVIKFLVGKKGVRIPARYVINACGLGSRQLVDTYHGEAMDINPRRGQFVVYDRDSSHLVSRILLPIPTTKTKGMLVSPTIFGNLLAGPTAEDLPPDQIHSTGTTPEGISAVLASARQMCPALADQPVIATYAGLRCNCAQGSYWMRFNDGHPGIVTLSGIRSTGLTTSISTAQYVIQQMTEQCGLAFEKNNEAVDHRPETKWPGWWRQPFDNPERLAERPDYGRIVCSCENISRGELQDALDSCPGAATLDGLKRRTRVLTGRCQGFNCCVPTAEMISQHYKIPLASVTKCGPGSEFIAAGDGRHEPPSIPAPGPLGTTQHHFRVVVVGAGPAGIGTAVGLAKDGISSVLLVDRAPEIGGVPAKFEVKRGGVPTFVAWTRGRVLFGKEFVERLARELRQTNTDIWLDSQVIDADKETRSLKVVSPRGRAEISADAVVIACGAREKTRSERGWIVGDRPARQFFTMQLIELLDGCHALPMQRPAIIGSDLIAYSAAAKLRTAGSQEAIVCDRSRRPAARLLERLYFGKWSRPVWHPAVGNITIADTLRVTGIEVGHHRQGCDGIVFSGELLPNSELIAAAGLGVTQPDRLPVRRGRNELSEPGWFIAGAVSGGLHGADWCYRDGLRAASAVSQYLKARSAPSAAM